MDENGGLNDSLMDMDIPSIDVPKDIIDNGIRKYDLDFEYKYMRSLYLPSTEHYFVTFTISPKLFKYKAVTQFNMTTHEVQCIIRDICPNDNSLCVELTDKGNVHYHGVMRLKDKCSKIKLYEAVKRKRVLGFCNITKEPMNSQESIDRVCKYMCKDLNETTKFIRMGTFRPRIIMHQLEKYLN